MTPVVLSYGLGVDSTAILLRWIHEPHSRDFDLQDLIVVTAMTGDEWPETGRMVEDHVLPLMRKHGIRYIQVARKTGSQTDGIVVLDDSRAPQRLYLDGAYKLSEEMLTAGTVPQMGGARKCSAKAKGWPLDTVIELALESKFKHHRHVMGFERDEPKRAVKDTAATRGNFYRHPEYPLIDWGWGRTRCEDYIRVLTGVDWWKSACVYCPFALANKAGRRRVLAQYRNNIAAAVDALFMEHVSLALNPRQGLNGELRLYDLIRDDGNVAALAGLQTRLGDTEHGLYRVRRVIRPKRDDPTKMANASRAVELLATGTKPEMEAQLATQRGETEHDGNVTRKWVHRRGADLPSVEELLVVAPSVVDTKVDPKFEGWWSDATRVAA